MSIQKATGNMYPWVDYVHSYLRGACPYKCPYCYVQAIAQRFGKKAMQGPLRFAEDELKANYNNPKYYGKTIFVEHTHDLFNPHVTEEWIAHVLAKCKQAAKENRVTFVFQTRNPLDVYEYAEELPEGCIFGTTIETNRPGLGKAPIQEARAAGIGAFQYHPFWKIRQTFITIEPILKFDLADMMRLIDIADPTFINIGADSKGTGLEEPTAQEIRDLIAAIKDLGIEIRTKRNLDRILKKD